MVTVARVYALDPCMAKLQEGLKPKINTPAQNEIPGCKRLDREDSQRDMTSVLMKTPLHSEGVPVSESSLCVIMISATAWKAADGDGRFRDLPQEAPQEYFFDLRQGAIGRVDPAL
ncbi:hypothetical protein NDU88_006856 [Pleurodeles waltl]|uniref:Uncharacterized protein n=1 Tax=Pleurodeles waltl TaxID=8319 RepID=A0AAV7MH80_PLEWA|nr:hypothetical protein NDU88_006856 [Pleurodeles waltl]